MYIISYNYSSTNTIVWDMRSRQLVCMVCSAVLVLIGLELKLESDWTRICL